MATRGRKPEPVGPPQLPPDQATILLRRQIGAGAAILAKQQIDKNEYGQWQLVTKNVLEKAFGTNSPNVVNFESAARLMFITGDTDWQRHYRDTIETQLSRLAGLTELIETEQQLRAGVAPHATNSDAVGANAHGIFVVHGHNATALHEVARFLEKLRQQVVVLREQPNRGQTVIEKFEIYANVGFAVVLLTGDDHGGVVGTDSFAMRARQNVVFELGYFIGRLGRNRVCALYQPGVELPSDYSGVLYYELDVGGSWRLQLARELKAAGLPVDMNDAL